MMHILHACQKTGGTSEICTKEWSYTEMPLSDECSVSAEITERSCTKLQN